MTDIYDTGRYKFVAVVIMFFLLPFLLLSRHFLYENRELAKKDALMYMELRTKTLSNASSDMLALNYDISRTILAPSFISASTAERKKILGKKVTETPSIFSEFSILSATGKELARTGSDAPKDLKDYSKTEIFRKAASGSESAGAVEYGEYTPPVLVLVQPVSKRLGDAPVCFVMARMSLASMGELVRLMGKDSAGNIGLVDAGGQMIADSLGSSVIAPGLKAPAEALKAIEAAYEKDLNSFRTEVLYKGRTYLVSVSGIRGTRWWLFETVDAARAQMHGSAAAARRVVWAGVLMILIFSVFTYKLAIFWLVPGRS